MSWKDNLKHGFVSGVLAIILFGVTYFFDFYGFVENYPRVIAVLWIFVLPPMGLFALMSRKRKAAPSVVSVTPPPRVILNESPLDKLKRLESESPVERIERIKREAQAAANPASPEKPVQLLNPPVEPQPPAKAPTTGYCVKCKAERVIVEPKADTMKNGRAIIRGICPACSTQIFRIGAMNGHADNEVPIPFTITLAGQQHEFEYGISPTELISKGKRKA